MNNLVIGKRVTVGVAMGQLAAIFAHFYPEHAAVFVSAASIATFVAQVAIARYSGVTTK